MSTISASTTSTTAYKVTADTTGTLVFQTGASPTTAMTLGSDQSVTFAGTPTYSGGTANGVAYLNGSKVFTTGSALVFDGTNLGLGASPNAWVNTSTALQLKYSGSIWNNNDSTLHFTENAYYDGTNWKYIITGAAANYYQTGANHNWRAATSGSAGASITWTTTMALASTGYVTWQTTDSAGNNYGLVGDGATNGAALWTNWSTGNSYFDIRVGGTTSTYTKGRFDNVGNFYATNGNGISITNGGLAFLWGAGQSYVALGHVSGTPSTSYYMPLYYNGTIIGGISQNGTTAITYATSSDYRLKHDIAPMTGALAKVAALKPVTYKWNSDDSEGEGFIAHELAEICPSAVVGEKDAVDEDGNPKYQGIDTSFLVATLTAAIQEQQAIIENLTNRITALEAK